MVSTVDGTVLDVPVVEGAVVIEVTGFSDGLTTEVTDGLSTEGRGGERGTGEGKRRHLLRLGADHQGARRSGRKAGLARSSPRCGGL
jgi:hypothetical protein